MGDKQEIFEMMRELDRLAEEIWNLRDRIGDTKARRYSKRLAKTAVDLRCDLRGGR